MARNGSGVYSVVNTFVSGATITASGHNQNWSDIAAEITNSVAADGQTTMTGPLRASSGTVAAPSQTFGADTDTGRYRKASNTMADVCGGAEVVEYSSTGIAVTGAVTATTVDATTVKQGGFTLLPVGLGPLPWTRTAAPSGWVLAAGQSLSRTTYAALWAVAEAEIALGNLLYTNGDGSTTFTVADMRGRVPAGKDDMGGVSAARLSTALTSTTLGASGGTQTFTLTTPNLPPYTPAGTNTSGAGVFNFTTSNANWSGGSNATVTGITQAGGGSSVSVQFTQPTFTGTAQGGTSTAFSLAQPTLILNYIIFAGV